MDTGAVAASLARLLAGWVSAVAVGIAIGTGLGLSAVARDYLGPAISFLRAIPPPALLPLFIVLLGIGVALTGSNPTLMGVLMSTFIMSVGFHYFETVNTSMQLQLLPKAQAPSLIGLAGELARVLDGGAGRASSTGRRVSCSEIARRAS